MVTRVWDKKQNRREAEIKRPVNMKGTDEGGMQHEITSYAQPRGNRTCAGLMWMRLDSPF